MFDSWSSCSRFLFGQLVQWCTHLAVQCSSCFLSQHRISREWSRLPWQGKATIWRQFLGTCCWWRQSVGQTDRGISVADAILGCVFSGNLKWRFLDCFVKLLCSDVYTLDIATHGLENCCLHLLCGWEHFLIYTSSTCCVHEPNVLTSLIDGDDLSTARPPLETKLW